MKYSISAAYATAIRVCNQGKVFKPVNKLQNIQTLPPQPEH